jgi:NADPH-dependent F420 reductase
VPLSFAGGKVTLLDVAEGSAAAHVRARLPAHARLAVAFKTIPAHLLNDIDRPLDCDEFVCADTPDAREQAAALVRAMAGLRPVDAGPLSRARSVEHLTLLAIAINRRHKIHDARFRIMGL